MLEKDIERRVGQVLKARGALWLKWVSPGMAGVPDRICITADGRVVFVELKTVVGRLTPLQEQAIRKLRARHAEVRVVYGLEQGMALVDEIAPAPSHEEGRAE